MRGKKPFIIRNNFNKNKEIKHDIYYELKSINNTPKFDYVLKSALDDVKNKKIYILFAMKKHVQKLWKKIF